MLRALQGQPDVPSARFAVELPDRADVERCYRELLVDPQFEELIVKRLPPAKALRFIGLKLWEKGERERAACALSSALALAPGETELWNDLAGIRFSLGSHAEAAACAQTSLELNADQPRIWLFLGMASGQMQRGGEAEAAYRRALALEPALTDAWFGLALLCFEQRRFEEAAAAMRTAIAKGCEAPAANACLGQALYLCGDFSGAANAFEMQAAVEPVEPKFVQKLALTRFIEALIECEPEEAISRYLRIAGPHAEDIGHVTLTAFHLLSAYGHREAALRLGQARQKLYPADVVQSYLLAALAGEDLARAPEDYVVRYFDGFAEDFDKKLVGVLDYRIPEKVGAMLAATGRRFARALDLGCGTGLAGPILRPMVGHLVGVDLAPKMLERAAARQVYDRLVAAEAVAFLAGEARSLDLLVAADVLVYIGDLGDLFAAARRALAPGGLFAFSIETTEAGDYVILPSGRFAHSRTYIEELARDGFRQFETLRTTIRLEANCPVAGAAYVLERAGI